MNAQIAAYEQRLRIGAEDLERREVSGRRGVTYEKRLRNWLELLAAYEYECEIAAAGNALAQAI